MDYSSSSEDISLERIHHKLVSVDSFDDTDQDKTFIPNSKELNSTDTEYVSDLSEKTKKKHDRQKKATQSLNKYDGKRNARNKSHSIRKQRKQSISSDQNEDYISQMHKAMYVSQTEELLRSARRLVKDALTSSLNAMDYVK